MALVVLAVLPDLAAVVGSASWFASSCCLRYRLVIVGREHIPRTGPVLIACNHVSWLDGFFLAGACPRRGQALVSAAYIGLADPRPVAALDRHDPGAALRSEGPAHLFEISRKVLDEGGVLGIFPEAQISRNGLTGAVLPRHRGHRCRTASRSSSSRRFSTTSGAASSASPGGRFFGKHPQGPAADGDRRLRSAGHRRRSPRSPSVRPSLETGVTAFEHRGRAS